MSDLTAELVRSILDYCPATGVFVWRSGRGKASAGAIAGSPDQEGYIAIGINRKRYKAHRLAWLCVYGEWPSGAIDHVDCNKSHNSISNLRVANSSQNRCNVGIQRINTTGFKGVTFNKRAGRFRSIIKRCGEARFLGYFDTAEAAHEAYKAAASEMHGEFARVA